MSDKAGFSKIAIMIFITAIILEILMIANNVPVESLWTSGTIENNMAYNVLMRDDSGVYSDSDQRYLGTVLGSEINRERIVTVTFLDTLDAMTDNAWDVSQEQNGTVMAWMEPNASDNQKFDLFIGAEGMIQAENCIGLFRGYYNVKAIDFNDSFDTSSVTDMSAMFQYCEKLTQLDISSFDTSQVTDMTGMFNGCIGLTWLNVSSFNTSQVTNMKGMFCECRNLEQLDISDFDTSQVVDMHWMFMNCESLTQLDVSNFDTSQVTNMWRMFSGCKSLMQLDVSNFDTSQVTEKGNMFEGCGITAEEANFGV